MLAIHHILKECVLLGLSRPWRFIGGKTNPADVLTKENPEAPWLLVELMTQGVYRAWYDKAGSEAALKAMRLHEKKRAEMGLPPMRPEDWALVKDGITRPVVRVRVRLGCWMMFILRFFVKHITSASPSNQIIPSNKFIHE